MSSMVRSGSIFCGNVPQEVGLFVIVYLDRGKLKGYCALIVRQKTLVVAVWEGLRPPFDGSQLK